MKIFFINLATGQIFMSSQANLGPHIQDTTWKIWTTLTWRHALLQHIHIYSRKHYCSVCIGSWQKQKRKSVRTALACFSSEEKQWVLCTWLSQFIRIRIISSLAQKLRHMQAMLMSLAPGNNQERRPKGSVECVVQPATIWKHYTSTDSTLL